MARAERTKFRLQRVAGRIQPHGVHAGLSPHGEPGADHLLGADQCGGQHHLVGDQRGRAVAVTPLPALAHLGGDVGPALPAVGLVVVVRARRTHPAEAEHEFLLAARDHAAQFLLVGGEGDLGALADVDVGAGAAGRGQALVEVGEVRVAGALRDETGAQPAVGDPPRQPQHRRRQRGQVDRDPMLGPGRQPHRHRFAAGQGDLKLPAGVRDFCSGERLAHDVDGFGEARQGPAERDTVQALDHLRAGRAQPEQEPPARQVGQRDGGLGDHDGRADADL